MARRASPHLGARQDAAPSPVGDVFQVKYTNNAEQDLYAIRKNARARRLIEAALARLSSEGPCIGMRLRGVGRNGFCRLDAPEHATNTWRVIYQWPPAEGEPQDVIWVWMVKEETPTDPETDVYLLFDGLLGRRAIRVGPYRGDEPRRKCCEPENIRASRAPAPRRVRSVTPRIGSARARSRARSRPAR